MRNLIKTAVVSAVAAVFVASVAVAGGTLDSQEGPQGQAEVQQQRRGRGPGGPGFGGPGGPGGPGGRGGFAVIMRELTPEQRTQVRAIMEESRPDGPPAEGKLRRDLEAELLADVPNEARIEELRQQIIAAAGEGLTRHIAVQKKVAAILTPEQKAKARERLAEGPQGRGPGRR
jgi:Spy/CpxP family protein refolding chaperone